ncbi:MAG: hypothetical protein JSW62_04725 [Thermoplasmatales archaeon]|nr:MAG: hypothetical protein JSW62_04725 [Thermoplasmatales archaeon]
MMPDILKNPSIKILSDLYLKEVKGNGKCEGFSYLEGEADLRRLGLKGIVVFKNVNKKSKDDNEPDYKLYIYDK